MQESNGFPCPECGTPLRIEVGRLLSGQPFFCSGCGLELKVDPEASAAALAAARTYKKAIDHSDEAGGLKDDRG